MLQQLKPKEIDPQPETLGITIGDHDQRSTVQSAPLFVLEPSHGWISLQLKSLWEYRELFYFLAWRDIKVRYKQTGLGIAWAILQPLAMMLLFSLIFGYLGGMPSDGIPYPIFTYVALLPWQLFANALASSSNSLVMNQGLITKVYFPRLIVPLSAVLVGLVDFAFSFIILLGMMYYYGVLPTIAVLSLPVFIVLAIATALAVSLWLSALNVQYRDVQHIIPFLTQFWFFATPIVYSSSLVPAQWRALYGLNPMVGVIEGFRWALLGQARPLGASTVISILIIGLILFGGLLYFQRMEKTFADVV
jgi:lipopolysaccharide transport system permease protein